MNDRELLELAARAAGLPGTDSSWAMMGSMSVTKRVLASPGTRLPKTATR
ncbi:TPA: hypothetical protein L4S00_002644 [Pseudomonas aeruginosa]|nr:hypothetical protein [Pseudomonas aeruginosa]HBO4700062.1 hypothetical protein [Pseudomonas aeruginosa]